jgi:hypothetical protein
MMKKRAVRWLIAPVAAACGVALTPGVAQAREDDNRSAFVNSAIAVSASPGRETFRLAFQVDQTSSPTVAAVNLASATTFGCANCRSVAVAFQVVVEATSRPKHMWADNRATALNVQCVQCSALASAYLFVVEENTPGHLPAATMRTLNSVHRQLRHLQRSSLPTDQVRVRVDQLAARVALALQQATSGHAAPGAAAAPLAKPAPGTAAPLGGSGVEVHRVVDQK